VFNPDEHGGVTCSGRAGGGSGTSGLSPLTVALALRVIPAQLLTVAYRWCYDELRWRLAEGGVPRRALYRRRCPPRSGS